MTWYIAFVIAVGVERIAELIVTRRNAAWSFAHGGYELGQRHYPLMVILHTGFLAGCMLEVTYADRPFLPWLGWPAVAVVLASEALRWWCIATLGPQWNTRVIIVPGLDRVMAGPYRWLDHPNYAAVVAEGIALPLVHTAWLTMVIFTVLNAALLRVRISVENTALQVLRSR